MDSPFSSVRSSTIVVVDDVDDEYRQGLVFNEEEEEQETQEDERFLEDSTNTRASVICAREGETHDVV